jgi:hypothetical protein
VRHGAQHLRQQRTFLRVAVVAWDDVWDVHALGVQGHHTLTIVTSNIHEHLKELINKIVNAVTMGDLTPGSRAQRGR